MQYMTFTEMHVKWSVILRNRFGPEILPMLEIRGQVLHRMRVHLKVDEGLTLETSAFQIVHGGNSTFINTFDKPNFPVRLNQARVQGFFF